MKVYVSELPKDCWDCPMHDGENGWCKILVCYTDYIPKECPLQPLTDHDKQVRKEVIEEIKKNADVILEEGVYENYITGEKTIMTKTIYNIDEVKLDQIQGERK